MKKLFAILLSAVVTFSLFACGNQEAPDNSTAESGTSVENSESPFTTSQDDEQSKADEIPENPASDFTYKYEASLNGVVITEYIGSAIKVKIPEMIENEPVVGIDSEAFYEKGIKEVFLPNSVTSIGEEAFYRCTGLTSVTIPDSVTSIEYGAFWGCTGLTSVTIPDSVTSIGDFAFIDCKGLTSITIPNSVTSIEYGAFWGCTGLTSVTIPDSVTSIEYGAFWGCDNLPTETKNKIKAINPSAIN